MAHPGAQSIDAVLYAARAALADSPTPALDARLLFSRASGLSHATLIANGDAIVSAAVMATFAALLERRIAHEPIALILGEQEFYGRPFKVTGDTLIPRPETEMLIEAAIKTNAPEAARLLDLGTGSGCLLVTLLAEWPKALGVGLDLSDAALEVAKKNAAAHGVTARTTWVSGDFSEAPQGPFDLIVSNPPYVEVAAPLPRSVVAFEPAMALFAGEDGLAAYRAIAPLMARLLTPGGHGFLEIGAGQGGDVVALMEAAMPDRPVGLFGDFCGLDRLVSIGPRGIGADQTLKSADKSGIGRA